MNQRIRYGAAALVVALLSVPLLTLPSGASNDDWQPSAAGWTSGPIEHLKTVAEETGGAVDAVRHGNYLYVSSWRSFSIYDVSDPINPQRLSTTPLGPALYNEQPQTNGDILLLSLDAQYLPRVPGAPAGGGVLEIWDVRDKSAPKRIGQYLSASRDHLWTCVDECRYAYSAFGSIVDLRDPSSPARIGDWRIAAGVAPRLQHHIAEIAPGRVLVGSVPMFLLDTSDPAAPQKLAAVTPPTTKPTAGLTAESIPARVRWPRAGLDRFSVVSMETPFTGPCSEQSGKVHTFDTTGWQGTGTFELLDTYQIASNGIFLDGRPPYNAVGCGAYGLSTHPSFNNGGLAAVVFFEHGLRLLSVGPQGELSEVAGFLPHGGNSAVPLWMNDEILYILDLHRGIDVLRVSATD